LVVHTTVAALLVSHDGERWLPAVISGLQSQTAPVEILGEVANRTQDRSGPQHA
jgi:hypothetical protein